MKFLQPFLEFLENNDRMCAIGLCVLFGIVGINGAINGVFSAYLSAPICFGSAWHMWHYRNA